MLDARLPLVQGVSALFGIQEQASRIGLKQVHVSGCRMLETAAIAYETVNIAHDAFIVLLDPFVHPGVLDGNRPHLSQCFAAFIYILIAHIGAILILLSFGIMAGFATGFESFRGYTFEAMRSAQMPAVWASIVFIAAFLGFAAKAGVIPLHVWLPEAHPAAPSNVSALMSGVMLKTAMYGILRVGFDLASEPQWWWGGMVLVFGLFSAVLGILYALMQDDIKRLVAYSSVQNIGITLIAVGLAMIFAYAQMNTLARSPSKQLQW